MLNPTFPGKSPWERDCVEIIRYREEKSVCADKKVAACNLICRNTDNDFDAIDEIQMRATKRAILNWTEERSR